MYWASNCSEGHREKEKVRKKPSSSFKVEVKLDQVSGFTIVVVVFVVVFAAL